MLNLINKSIPLINRCSNKAFTKIPFQSLRISTRYYPQIRYLNTSKIQHQNDRINTLPKKKSIAFDKLTVTWRSVIFTIVSGGLLLAYMYHLKAKKEEAIEKERRREIGKASIGGKFELVNTEGKIVKSDDFLGQWVLIYFGFTHCPDVCPDEIEKMTAVVNELEKTHKVKVQPLFISVDPDRDTPEIVGKYIREFSDKIIGLTGSKEQVHKACKAYRVYYSNGPKDQDSDYIVDHTIIIYLIDPEGLFVDYFGLTHSAEQIVGSVLLNKYKYDKFSKDS